MPLYFDNGLTKNSASVARYRSYSTTSYNSGEYMCLNDQSKWVLDFKYDFAKGRLHLLPSAAVGDRRSPTRPGVNR